PTSTTPTRVNRSVVEHTRQLRIERLEQPRITAETVAALMHISVRTLHRSFATQGVSFSDMLRKLRVERAAQLLLQPRLNHLSITEIGRRCGFSDASHFVREFKLVHRLPPAKWRKSRIVL
ncbi:MAG: helix-turn-helix transcriptional regulator, partial [Casimicrobium sp.]